MSKKKPIHPTQKGLPQSKLKLNAAIASNIIVIFIVIFAAYFSTNQPEFYYRMMQEDKFLEWATFWAFALSGTVFFISCFRQYRSGVKIPWFSAGLAIFCILVALEEISWGQRLFSYRPPEYFLQNNYQQELNIHNVFSKDLRKLTLKLIIISYGVVFPVIALIPSVGKLFRRIGLIPPSITLIPAFLITFIIYNEYPFRYSGELVELMLGLGFLFSALSLMNSEEKLKQKLTNLIHITAAIIFICLLGATTTVAVSHLKNTSSELIETATKESEALTKDMFNLATGKYGTPPTRCGYHVRVYTYFNKYYPIKEVKNGYFDKLTTGGSSKRLKRNEYYLDPWNSPYWLRDICLDDGRRFIAVYSFGPDKKRQSLITEFLGDDIAKYIAFKPQN